MARIPLADSFTIIPEGEYTFGIYGVDYDEKFGAMKVNMVTAKGQTYTERFQLKTKDDTANEPALLAFSSFAKTALNDFSLTELDDEKQLIGHYIRGTVKHTNAQSTRDPSKTVTFMNLEREKFPADGFDTAPSATAMNKMGIVPNMSSDDIDSLLG